MARKKSEFLSALGTKMEMWKVIVAAVFNLGGSDDDLRRILTDKSLVGKIAEVIMASGRTVAKTLGDTYRVTVDYTRSLAEMIAAGKYCYANSDINKKNFPLEHSESTARTWNCPYRTPEQVVDGVIEVILIHLNKLVSTADVLRYLDENNLRPATLAELLAFGAENPEIQKQFPIIALGSVWTNRFGHECSPYLGRWDDGRRLNLNGHGDDWNGNCRFLAVGK